MPEVDDLYDDLFDLYCARGFSAPVLAAILGRSLVGERPGNAEEPDPLPPLEDLDEGLRCCGVPYDTFRAWLTHRRGHADDCLEGGPAGGAVDPLGYPTKTCDRNG